MSSFRHLFLFALLSVSVLSVVCGQVYHSADHGFISEVHDATQPQNIVARRWASYQNIPLPAVAHLPTAAQFHHQSPSAVMSWFSAELLLKTPFHLMDEGDVVPPSTDVDPSAGAPALNCTGVNCAALSDSCGACTSNPCCGFCATIGEDGFANLTAGTCYGFAIDPDTLEQTAPTACNQTEGSGFQWQDVCGAFDLPSDVYSENGTVDCSTVICSAKTCASCQIQSDCCGWCASSRTCVNYGGDEDNIQLGGCDSAENIFLYSCDNCANFTCSAISSCEGCAASSCCGWCPSSKSCLAVNATDPGSVVPLSPATCSAPLDVEGVCTPARGDGSAAANPASVPPPNNLEAHEIPVTHTMSTNIKPLAPVFSTYNPITNRFGHVTDPYPTDVATAIPGRLNCVYPPTGAVVGYRIGQNDPCFCFAGYRETDNVGECTLDPTLSNLDSWMFSLIPSCSGETSGGARRDMCDAPEMVDAYAAALEDTTTPLANITMDYAVYVVTNDDGSNPNITPEKIADQLAVNNQYFASAAIQWRSRVVKVANTAWRTKTAVPDACTPAELQNNVCTAKCNTEVTGFDGGACATTSKQKGEDCPATSKGNGVCDDLCNTAANQWDGGDCCSETDLIKSSQTCKDPTKPVAQRAYYQLSDLLNFVNASNSQQQNVFVIDAAGEQTMGVATFPQAKPEGVFAASGGSKFYSTKYWGLDKDASGKSLLGITALHELGHSLGLPHTFAGVQYTPCSDLCNERIQFSNVKDKTGKNAWFGDFASDTSPHPEYYECNDCTNCDNSKGCTTWAGSGTPYTNFMAYGDDTCLNTFSRQQRGRMRCLADSAYRGYWWAPTSPSSVMMQPVIFGTSTAAVTTDAPGIRGGASSSGAQIVWIPALAPVALFTYTYQVHRSPPFSNGANFIATPFHNFTDFDITFGTEYKYRIATVDANGVVSERFSPSLTVTLNNNPTSAKIASASADAVAVAEHYISLVATPSCPRVNGTGAVCNNQTCKNDGTCGCSAGYYGLSCSLQCNCQNGGVCLPTGACGCPTGFTGAKCQTLACPVGLRGLQCSGSTRGTCNTNTGVCSCATGFGGSACTNVVATSCPLSKNATTGTMLPCGGRGTCNNYNGYLYCVCPLPYRGVACQNKCPSVNGTVCSGRGVCQEDGSCACLGSFKGVACESQKPYTYYTADCGVRTTSLTDGMIALNLKKGACKTRQLFTFTDAAGSLNFKQWNYTALSSARQINPVGVPIGNASTSVVAFSLGERSQTKYVNWSTVTILTSTDGGKNWTALKNVTWDATAATVSATVNKTAMFVAVARPSSIPFSTDIVPTPIATSSSSSSTGTSGRTSSSTGTYVPSSAAHLAPSPLMVMMMMAILLAIIRA